ncbi:MAG TPA: hypothetical protein VD926_04140, partial [Acidimicrobiales bacterium]|nr:hypothetical protein [Acidimicrobiales bacterium]
MRKANPEDNGAVGAHRAAVAYCVRAEARRSWRSWLVLGLLIGLSAGAVLAAAAGARRTATAYQDLVEESAAPDGLILAVCGPDAPVCPRADEFAEEVRGWPGVAGAGAVASILTPIADRDGTWETQGDPCNTGTGEVSAIVPLDDHIGDHILRLRILEGRDVDPTRAGEAVLAPEAASAHGVEVGDTLFVHLGPEVLCDDAATWGERTELTVVGIGLSGLEVPPKTGFYIQGIHLSPALASMEAAQAQGAVAVRLAPGVTFDELQDRAEPPGFTLAFDRATDLRGDDVDAGLQSDANALWLVAALGAVAAGFVLGPTMARYRWSTASVDTTLGALGWSRSDRILRSTAHALAISGVAGPTVVGVMVATSTRTPIGEARNIEPNPGIEVDLPVLLLGWSGLTVLVTAGLAALAWRARAPHGRARRTPVAGAAARVGLPVRAVLGIRIGLEPGPRQAPVRSSVLAVALGIAGVIGVLVYTSGAQHLRQTPAWRGVPWDDIVFANGVEDGIGLVARAGDWPEVERAGSALFFVPPLALGPDHVEGRAMAFGTEPGAPVPTVIDGRAPTGPFETLLNPHLAGDLGVGVGDAVEATFDLSEVLGPEAGSSEAFTLQVVGLGVVPIGDGRFDRGMAITREGYMIQERGFRPDAEDPDDGPGDGIDFLLLDRHDGVTDADIVERLAAEGVEYDSNPAA